MLLALIACAPKVEPAPAAAGGPSTACEPAWRSERAVALVAGLDTLRSEGEWWPGWRPSDGVHVLDAGDGCVALYRGGLQLYAELEEGPTLLTPMFGYALPWSEGADMLQALGAASAQPAEVRQWLDSEGVRSAVITPLVIEHRLLAAMVSDLVALQIAVHESFHVQVQMPSWAGESSAWPAWDQQPDREKVKACYAATEELSELATRERQALARATTSALDGALDCSALAGFVDLRARRRSAAGPACAVSEAIMELEEGTADYASWGPLFAAGLADRETLISRYTAHADEPFYQLGAMQLHLMRLVDEPGFPARARAIAESGSVQEGAIEVQLLSTMAQECGE